MDTLATIGIGIIIVAVIVGLFCGLIWFGFRMGRQSIGQPLPPIVKGKATAMVEQDPYFEPMHGRPQPQTTGER